MGLRLSYDTSRTATENLYYQLYRQWPEKDLADLARDILVQQIQRLEHGRDVCAFFGLAGYVRVMEYPEEQLKYVEAGLREIYDMMHDEVAELFMYWKNNAAKDDHVQILAYCAVLLNKLQDYHELQERKREADFLATATIDDLDLSARVYNMLDRSRGFFGRIKLGRNSRGRVLISSLISYTSEELSNVMSGIRGFDAKALKELKKELAVHGLKLASTE